MKIFFIILLHCLLLYTAIAQDKKYKEYNVSAPKIEIVDSNFYYLLDTVLDLDKKCTYFSDSLWYSLWFGESSHFDEEHTVFQFEGNLNNGNFLEFIDSDIGVLTYGKHYFFISAKKYPKIYLKSQIAIIILMVILKNPHLQLMIVGQYISFLIMMGITILLRHAMIVFAVNNIDNAMNQINGIYKHKKIHSGLSPFLLIFVILGFVFFFLEGIWGEDWIMAFFIYSDNDFIRSNNNVNCT